MTSFGVEKYWRWRRHRSAGLPQTIAERVKSVTLLSHSIESYNLILVCLSVYKFSPSSGLLTNRLAQAHNICNAYSVNFSWSSKHIFKFLHSVIQSCEFFN